MAFEINIKNTTFDSLIHLTLKFAIWLPFTVKNWIGKVKL